MSRKLTWIGQRFTGSSYQLKTDQHPRQKGHFASLQAKKRKEEKTTTKKRTKATSGFIFKGCKGNGGTSVLIYGIIWELSLSLFLPVHFHIVTNMRTNLVTATESGLSRMIDVGICIVRKTNRPSSLIFYFYHPFFLFEPCCLLETKLTSAKWS